MRKTKIMFLLCLAGALLNIAFNFLFAGAAALPLYMDTVFTISLTLAGGLYWGMLCGALTNLIGHTILFWGWEGYLFIICNVATAVITALFIRFFPHELNLAPQSMPADAPPRSRRLSIVMDRMIIIILLSFCLCIAMSVLGGLIAALIQILIHPAADGQIHNPASATLSPIMFRYHLPVILAEILSRVPINVIDRLVSAFGGYCIALGIRRVLLGTKSFSRA